MAETEGGMVGAPSGPNAALNFLTPEELATLTDGVRGKVAQVFTELTRNYHNAVNQRQRDRVALEQSISSKDADIMEFRKKEETFSTQLAAERKTTEEYIERYRKTLTSTNELEDTVRKLQNDLSQTSSKAEQLTSEMTELLGILEKRNAEIEKLTADGKNLSDQLQSAIGAKIEALVKVDELTSKEMELDYKEKQLAKERDWVSKQVQLLNEELDRKNSEVIEIHRDSSLRFLSLQSEVSEKGEQLRIAELNLENVKKINEDQEKHIERLIGKLKDAQDMELKLEENYRQELKSQKRIAELYKDSSEESGKKVEELEDAVSNLQDLLKLATDRYGELETKFQNAGKSFQEEVTQRDEKIANLSRELDQANELLTNIQRQGMTDEMITSLSPAAAAACSLLKNSRSLTEIYSKHQNLNTELILAREENERLNNHIHEILQDIEMRAPAMREQQEDHERALETVLALTNQLDLAMESETTAREECALAKKTLGVLERENKRLKVQLNDSACQIKSLLREVESQRGSYVFQRSGDDDGDRQQQVPDLSTVTDSSRVISDRLVTFRNIDELQAQNQYLLALVREFSSASEQETQNVDSASQSQMEEVKKAFEEAKKELETLRETRLRQERMFQSVIEQRDSYAALVAQKQQQTRSPTKSPMKAQTAAEMMNESATLTAKCAELEKQLNEEKGALKELKEEYDTYRKEKSEHEKIAAEQMERIRDDLTKMRADNAKLSSQQEYNNERAKIYNSNLESYKKTVGILEEKNKQLNLNVAKHEQANETLKKELIDCQQKLARTEVALASMGQERNMLRDAKSRLQAERDLLTREYDTQKILKMNIEEIKNNFDMAKTGEKIKLENQVEALQQECTVLRRKVDTENDRFREMVFSWDKLVKELREKLTKEGETQESIKKELSNAKDMIRTQRNEIEELLSKIRVLTGQHPTATGADAAAASGLPSINQVELEKKTKELNLKLIEAQTEIRSLKQQLEISKGSVEEFKSLCVTMEEQLASAANNSQSYNDEFAERLAGKDDIIRSLQARLDVLEKEAGRLKDEKEKIVRDVEGQSSHLEEELARMQRELQVANAKMLSVVEENVQLTQSIEKQIAMRDEIQQKYERDITRQSQEQERSGDLSYELNSLREELATKERARVRAEEALGLTQSTFEQKENAFKAELVQLRQNLAELETINNGLQDQLIALTTQKSSMRQAQGEEGQGPSSADTSLSTSFIEQSEQTEQEKKTSEQWMQLIRYMRRQKDIAFTKTEMAETAMQRMETQLKFMEKQYEEVKKKLDETQDKSHVNVITSAKQADLLRKVETLSALTDSNRMLREEKDAALREIQDLKSKVAALEAEMVSLRLKASEFESKCDSLSNENVALKQDTARWRTRASALLEKSNKINPEEWKKLQTEKDNLTRQVQGLQENVKKQQQEGLRQNQQIQQLQQQVSAVQASSQAEKAVLAAENAKLKEDLDAIKVELHGRVTELGQRGNELHAVREELTTTLNGLEEQKNMVKQVKNIARRYKKQYEDTLVEKEGLAAEKTTLEGQIAANAAAAEAAAATASTSNTEASEAQKQQFQEAHSAEIATLETKIRELTEEGENLKREMETVKTDCSQREERAKLAMKAVREKMNACNQQKLDAETELAECKARLASLETNETESAVRFAALKSQYDGKLGRLEKENKDLKAGQGQGTSVVAPSAAAGSSSELEQENERLKKDLEMNRQRILALEKQYKLTQQQQQQQQQQGQGQGQGPSATAMKGKGTDKLAGAEPPKANIKPIAGTATPQKSSTTQVVPPGTSRPQPTASIRPMSMLRKATVMPTAQPQQAQAQAQQQQQQQQPREQQQASQGQAVIQQQSVVIAPVSQGQVSTSTPDQSSGASSASDSTGGQGQGQGQAGVATSVGTSSSSTVTNSTNLRQATVQPTQAVSSVSVAPISSPMAGMAGPILQGPAESASDPSTSTLHIEDSEMGDSSEQVSSSEPSNHQLVLTVAPIRPQQDSHVQQSTQVQSAGSSSTAVAAAGQSSSVAVAVASSGVEEPSPSTSSTSSSARPTQSGSVSGKRARDSEVETSQESMASSEEPQSKRLRSIIHQIPVEREAEAMAHQQEQDPLGRESEEDEPQVPHSDTRGTAASASGSRVTTGSRGDDEDEDFDVIVIDSDDEEEGGSSSFAPQRGMMGRSHRREDIEDEPEEGESEEDVEEEELMGEEDEGDEEGDEEEDHDSEEEPEEDDDEDEMGLELQEADEDLQDEDVMGEPEEGREAESLENQPAAGVSGPEQRGLDGSAAQEAEADVMFIEDEPHQQEREDGDRIQDPRQPAELFFQVDSGEPRRSYEDRGGPTSSAEASASRAPTSSSSASRPTPVALSRPPRPQDRMLSYGRQQPLTPTFHSQHYGDDIDDSIVPSTPTLVVPRRADGFAEAVSSPHIPSQRLFTFGPPSDTTTGAGSSGLDDTRMDLLQYDDGTGRSVPTTPSQVSPPAEAIDQEQHGNIDLLDLVEERHMLRDELFDVQPSSSDGHSHRTGGDVPAITITSVLDSSLDSPMEQQEAESDNVALQEDFEQSQDGSNEQVHSLPPTRTESSVTSSDEDKIDLGASTSDLVPQQPSTSSSSRPTSPSPSNSNAPSAESGDAHAQQPQQHRVRPTPIIWDQPTSSSSVPPAQRVTRGRGVSPAMGRVPPQLHIASDPSGGLGNVGMRGGFRQLRGAVPQQSARRSRPHGRGGPPGRGGGAGRGAF